MLNSSSKEQKFCWNSMQYDDVKPGTPNWNQILSEIVRDQTAFQLIEKNSEEGQKSIASKIQKSLSEIHKLMKQLESIPEKPAEDNKE